MKLSEMSPDDMRVEMALLDGRKPKRMWRVFYDKERQHAAICISTREEALHRLKHETESSKSYGWDTSEFSEPEEYDEWEDAPDYLNSLDAVAPVEARMTEEQRENVVNILETTTDNAVFATALQRTKAILLSTRRATL